MPIDYRKYSPMWKIIRAKIMARAGNHCELCDAENCSPHWKTGSRVVLTVHHINHDITDGRDSNLIALCQRCHIRLDRPWRVRNGAKR